ncbi:MAG: DnaJ domain-containing protein [Verrucomicrobiae bacterium]|nr:DnaJ domain-containing protein [Verrucomicrobiae bacterium]
MAKDYYVILGVEPDAGQEEIRSAFRRRALETHPDRFGADAEPFIEVQEAYRVLSNERLRAAYDAARRRRRQQRQSAAEPLRQPRRAEPLRATDDEGINLGEASLTQSFQTYRPSFEDVVGRLWTNFYGAEHPKAEHVEELIVDIPITPAQARWGGHVRLLIPAQHVCPTCEGERHIGGYPCFRCGGLGVVVRETPVEVSYPPQVVNHYLAHLPLEPLGITNLYLTVRFCVTDHPDE